jgi:NitT/TauT family transport system substrate-binding protein
MNVLEQDKRLSAKIYVQQADSGLSPDLVERMIRAPGIRYTVVPQNVLKYATFLQHTGAIRRAPGGLARFVFSRGARSARKLNPKPKGA